MPAWKWTHGKRGIRWLIWRKMVCFFFLFTVFYHFSWKFWLFCFFADLSNTKPKAFVCLDDTDLKLSQLIWAAVRGRRNDEMIRLWVWYIPYSFRDVQGLLLASAWNTEYKAPSSFASHVIDKLLSFCWCKSILKILAPSSQQARIQPLDHLTATTL